MNVATRLLSGKAYHLEACVSLCIMFLKVRYPPLAPVLLNQFWTQARFYIFSWRWSKGIRKQWESCMESLIQHRHLSNDHEHACRKISDKRIYTFDVNCQVNTKPSYPWGSGVYCADRAGDRCWAIENCDLSCITKTQIHLIKLCTHKAWGVIVTLFKKLLHSKALGKFDVQMFLIVFWSFPWPEEKGIDSVAAGVDSLMHASPRCCVSVMLSNKIWSWCQPFKCEASFDNSQGTLLLL